MSFIILAPPFNSGNAMCTFVYVLIRQKINKPPQLGIFHQLGNLGRNYWNNIFRLPPHGLNGTSQKDSHPETDNHTCTMYKFVLVQIPNMLMRYTAFSWKMERTSFPPQMHQVQHYLWQVTGWVNLLYILQ